MNSTHPYLFFSRAELAALRKCIVKPPYATRWKQFLRNADGCLRSRPYEMPDVRYSLGVCGMTGFAYAILQDRRYGVRAIKEANKLLSAPRWHAGYEWNRAADLPTSEAALACAFVYDWCHDLFSASEAAEFRKRLLKLSTRVYLESIEVYKDWWIDNPVSNWCGVCHGGNGLAALAMYHEEPLARRAAKIAWKAIPKFLRHVNLVDGGAHEGVMYKLYGESFGHIFFAAASRLFGTDGGLYADMTRKRTGYWLIYMKGHDDCYANFNNMNEDTCSGSGVEVDERGPHAPLCALFESKVPGGDTLLRWGADAGGASYYYYGTDPLWFVFRSTRPAVKTRPKLSDAVLFRGAGHAVIQSEKLWLAYNGGWISNSSHANNDLGTFVLTWNGTRLINDPGYGFMATADHSTLVAGKRDQVSGTSGKFLRFGSGRGFHYFSNDLSAVNPGLLKRFVRHVVIVNGRYVVLLDDVRITGPGRLDLDLHFQTRGRVRAIPAENRAEIVRGGEKLNVIAAAPSDAIVRKGRRQLSFVKISQGVRQRDSVFASVLYPDRTRAAAPRIECRVTNSKLLVSMDGDRIEFARTGGVWKLLRVNGESAARIPPASKQSLFRIK